MSKKKPIDPFVLLVMGVLGLLALLCAVLQYASSIHIDDIESVKVKPIVKEKK